jgi:hypothetical protein
VPLLFCMHNHRLLGLLALCLSQARKDRIDRIAAASMTNQAGNIARVLKVGQQVAYMALLEACSRRQCLNARPTDVVLVGCLGKGQQNQQRAAGVRCLFPNAARCVVTHRVL